MVLKDFKKQQLIHSVMSYINLSLFTIIGITLISIFYSFWMTEQADTDAHAINLSGSMRMQTFHIGLIATHSPKDVPEFIEKLDNTWKSPLFTTNQDINVTAKSTDTDNLPSIFKLGYRHWFDVVKPHLLKKPEDHDTLFSLLTKQVQLTDKLVNRFQYEAESKIRRLRTFQLIAMLITTLVGSLIFYLLKNKVETPLSRLTEAAKRIRDGYIQQHIHIPGKDELALLAKAFNQMSQSISETYQQLENRVESRTKELQQSNTILEYSFSVARKVLEDQDKSLDYTEIIHDLSTILMVEDVELCLFTEQGEQPYLQLEPDVEKHPVCDKRTCGNCKGDAPYNTINMLGFVYKYPVIHLGKQYGVITVRPQKGKALLFWQQKLAQSSADQLSIALSLQETKEQEHRFAMLSERTVMARELHDSLAQSLSYLKIQITRLQKSHDMQKYELQQPIINELSEGLSSAYRHLRELLTTFRLKVDDSGLKGAIEKSVKQLKARTDMEIDFQYKLTNVPLNPTEEIHLLQIMREASQNAVNHSKGSLLKIHLQEQQNKQIQLVVEDNGVGLSNNPEKLNHYGLEIIKERSRSLGGDLKVRSSQEGLKGTCINLRFEPAYLFKK
tara:strand:- start:9044 stop:10888 length:1845 start_codon:yes stop_codon:yes gene_type:complete